MENNNQGQIHIVCGPMYCGKSSELIRLARRELIANKTVQVFKYEEDNRYSENDLASHDKLFIPAEPVLYTSDIYQKLKENTDTIIVDEVQFLDDIIIPFSEYIRDQGKRIILAGLDLDFRGEPFPFNKSNKHMGELLAKADYLEKLTAICTYSLNGKTCGEDAKRTQRLINQEPAPYNSPIKLIGAKDNYEARCIKHHFVPGKPVY
ncbi:thymidine kinase [Candidatus Woesearchaeota archaeon]|nr:thymidine kinase [Candidatus Woesearchaeota archaeon]